MKILVTGICGFVGSEIARGLALQSGDVHEIVGIDNLSRRGSWLNRAVLETLGIKVLHGDIRCSSDLDQIGAVDAVIDAAANATVMAGVDGKASSRQLVENNLVGTINLLELCKRHQAAFVLLSTSRVYAIEPLARLALELKNEAFTLAAAPAIPGLTAQGIGEAFSTTAPVSLYGATKLASEQLALEYGNAFGFPVWINRCSVMAGAGQFARADQGIFTFWLHAWKEGRPLSYIGFGGHGYQVRDCLHPRDLPGLLQQQITTANDGRPAIVNLSGGAGAAMSLAQLSTWCAQRWGQRPVGAVHESRPYDLPWVVLDHELAARTWNWRPRIAITDILNEIAEFADTQSDWIGQSA
jgi:CDP-paratose 2-epimerase